MANQYIRKSWNFKQIYVASQSLKLKKALLIQTHAVQFICVTAFINYGTCKKY